MRSKPSSSLSQRLKFARDFCIPRRKVMIEQQNDIADILAENGYVQEAVEMLGKGYDHPAVEIEAPRTVIERTGGEFREVEKPAFVKISTSFKSELVQISDAALKVWIFIALSVNRNTGRANPGLRTIAKALGKGVNTIQECLQELEALKLLQVDRQSRKYNIYEPTSYVSANRSDPVSGSDTDGETVSEKPETVSENLQSVSDSRILNQRNQREPDLLDAEIHYHLKPKAIKDAFAKYFKLTPNWDAKYNRQFLEWLVDTQVTPEQVEYAADLWRKDKHFNWKAADLKGIQEHWLELIANITQPEPERKIYHHDPEQDKQYTPIPNRKPSSSFIKGGGVIPAGGTG
jgi:hypothetical protein